MDKKLPPVFAAMWGGVLREATHGLFPPIGIPLGSLELFRATINRAVLPPNLAPLHKQIDASAAFHIMKSEGVPLAPVPRAEIALELLNADDRSARRLILESRADDIADDCVSVMEGFTVTGTRAEWADFVLKGVQSLRDGHVEAAQALFSVIVTTAVGLIDFGDDSAWKAARRSGVGKERKYELDSAPEELGELPGWEYWVAAPLWHAYPSADFGEGAELRDRWSRNASVHAVSRVHYNLANTVISMMFATTVLDFLTLWKGDD